MITKSLEKGGLLRMRKSKKFIGMPVISLAEGQQIGTVKGLVVDPLQKVVAALIIEQKGWFKDQKFAPYGKVRSVGHDAITIDKSAHVEKSASLPGILNLYKEKVSIIDCKVLAENGSQLGIVDEYFVDETTGAIVGLELSGNLLNSIIKGRVFLDSSFIQTIGKELVVTSNEAIENLVKIDGGLQETMKHLKDSTSQLWENTIQKTKEFSSKTKELGNKTKEELESKTKGLSSLTKDLTESLKEQLDKVRKKESSVPVEADVKIEDLPPEAFRSDEDSLNRAPEPVEDKVEVVDLPPEVQLTRGEESPVSSEEVEVEVEAEVKKTDEEKKED